MYLQCRSVQRYFRSRSLYCYLKGLLKRKKIIIPVVRFAHLLRNIDVYFENKFYSLANKIYFQYHVGYVIMNVFQAKNEKNVLCMNVGQLE